MTSARHLTDPLTLLRRCARLATAAALFAGVPATADVLVETTSGGNTLPLIITGQYQQTYGAEAFAALRPGGEVITGIAFALNPVYGQTFSGTVSSLDIRLSTIPTSPSEIAGLVPLGTDSVTVRTGAAQLSGINNQVTPTYDIVIPFHTPFHYDPARGSLLLDIWKTGPSSGMSYGYLEAGLNSSISRAYAFSTAPSSGYSVGYGVATLFLTSPVPEGGTGLMLTLGLIALSGARRVAAKYVRRC